MPSIGGAKCLDLFAGTGALGLEALSRGAAFSHLIDTNSQVCRQLKQNIALLDTHQAEVTQANSIAWLAQYRDQLKRYDIIFIDPPFALNLWDTVIKALDGALMEGALIYCESPKTHALTLPDYWQVLRAKSAGSVAYRLIQA